MIHTEFAVLTSIWALLSKQHRRKLVALLGGTVALALLEMISVGAIAFMAMVITDPDGVLASPHLAAVPFLHDWLVGMPHGWLILLVSALAGVTLAVKNAAAALLAYANASLTAHIDAHIGELLLSNLLDRPYLWRLGRSVSDLFTLVTWRKHLGAGILFMTVQTVADSLVILFLFVGLLIASPVLSGLLIASVGLAGLGVLRLSRPYFERVGSRYKKAETEVNRLVHQTLGGHKEITLFGLVPAALAEFRTRATVYARLEGISRLLSRLPSLVFEVLGFSILFAAIAILIWYNQGSPAAILGVLTLLTVTAWRVLNAVNRIMSSLSAIRLDLPPARQALAIINEIQSNRAPVPAAPIAFERDIAFRRVSFAYPGTPHQVLSNLDLTIRKGQSLGIAGRSGAGKSTFIDILIGLLPPDAGAVLVDGSPLTPEAAPGLWCRVGYVGQHPFIADATLAENIAFGQRSGEWDPERIRRCCHLAHVTEFLDALPHGLDTPLGEAGANLSGGQRQRVAIARALYRESDLLILDEATSALDLRSETDLAQTIRDLTGTATLVVVAHRLATLAACQEVLWLDGGRVRDLGPAEMVLARFRQEMLAADFAEGGGRS